MRRDPLIIGAGPSGTAAAITLGRAGFKPALIERASGPTDKVCGDFLSYDTIRLAMSLGVDPKALGAAMIDRVRLVKGDQVIETTLPFPACGLSRRTFDAALLRQAEAVGAQLHAGQSVRSLTREGNHWIAHLGSTTIVADTAFLATGKHDLRNWPRPDTAHGAVGMKTYLTLSPIARKSLDGVTALVLFSGGYAGLQCIEDAKAVLCIAVKTKAFRNYGGTWSALVAAVARSSQHFSSIMADAQPLLARPLAIAGVPYGYRAKCSSANGLFRLGDQAAVIPSLTGDGMAIALYSGQYAAGAWLNGTSSATYQNGLSEALARQMHLAGLLHRVGFGDLAQTLAMHFAHRFPSLLQQAATRTRLRAAATLHHNDLATAGC